MKGLGLGIVAVAFLMWQPVRAEGAPFCVVTNHGENCWYYDANQCRSQAARQGGMCVLNQQRAQPSPVLNAFEHISAAGEAGRRSRQERERHAAELRLLEAQTRAVASQGQGSLVFYKCPPDGGQPEYTEVPRVGCIVIQVGP